MRGIIKYKILLLFSLGASTLLAQEICTNGIDDNGDGLIDLNDPQCMCMSLIESSLIPNPSFEDMLCCPSENEMLNCAETWIQASIATSDYIHTCGNYLGNTSIPAFAPLPIADGEGAVGFRDGATGNPRYKEYIGACLTEPMLIGATYRLDFFVGFRDNIQGSRDLNLAFFGASNCSEIPFGGNNWDIGCPLNVGGSFEILAQQTVSGSNEWVNVVVEFVADRAFNVLVLGPSCANNPSFQLNPYFYVDRLALAEESEFGLPFESIQGSICENNLVLTVEDNPIYTYQWYKDGVAIVGETAPYLYIPNEGDVEGQYIASLITDDGCALSKIYNLRVPPYYAPINRSICEGESVVIGTKQFTEAGYHETTIRALDGCDSIIQLSLEVGTTTYGDLADTICQGDTYAYLDISESAEGQYSTTLQNRGGCDSILTIDLTVIEEGGGISLPEEVNVGLGEWTTIRPNNIDPIYIDFNWYDDSGMLLSTSQELSGIQVTRNTTYTLEALDQFGCGTSEEVQIRVDKSNIRFVMPNVFSPDGNRVNDFFRYYSTPALDRVLQFSIYDRWGNLVYNIENVEDPAYEGWDGRIGGKSAEMGVYVYYIKAKFLDDSEQSFTGNLTLVR